MKKRVGKISATSFLKSIETHNSVIRVTGTYSATLYPDGSIRKKMEDVDPDTARAFIICPKCQDNELQFTEWLEASETWLQDEKGNIQGGPHEGVILGEVLRVIATCSWGYSWVVEDLDSIVDLPNWYEKGAPSHAPSQHFATKS